MNRKIRAALIFTAFCVMMFTGCGKKEQEKHLGPAVEEPQTVTFEDGQDEGEQKVPEFIIKEEDAERLISEELSGTGCTTEFSESLEIDESGYYTYTVKDPEGKIMDQMLAVDGFSGDVKVYDREKNRVSDFSGFAYYEKSDNRFRDISWDGVFVNNGISIELVPADEAAFEFTISQKDNTLLVGMGSVEKNKAFWKSEDEKETIEFEMTDEGELEVTETGDQDLEISGSYKRK
ncbi:MAG: hypothetical protein K6F86_02915 [Lachnospiraceae bacterium]|nr:hypothetical protein [Lachnospiraceae bacterium]